MLTLHFSNRTEALSALLAAQLGGARADPFAADELVVPSAAVRRHLTLALATQHGVCANLHVAYLAQWLWQQVGRVLAASAAGAPAAAAEGADSPLQPALLAWRLWAAMADAPWVATQPRLAAYLASADAVTRYELARRVAGLLDQYGTYRPDWLAAWADGRRALPADSPAADDEAWQAALWRRVLAELQAGQPGPALPATTDPGQAPALLATLAALGDSAPAGAGLPAAAHVFCLPTIAPVHLALLQQLGRWMDLHVYALNPCREYWFEVVDRRRLAHLAARGQDPGHEVGHRLLAAWGQQAQAQLGGLVDACGDAVIDDGVFVAAAAPTLLGRLQDSILHLEDLPAASVPLDAADRSIEVHVCHSLTRELEVLHDTLLALLATPGAPAPGEILVVTPDLDAAAPLIEGVFGTAPPARALPFTITGRAVSQANAAARALLDLLALAGSRCTASAVFGLLQQPVVARRFGLDDEGLARVHNWLLEAGVHWALDGPHRADWGLPALDRHSFADGLDRLYLGYALPSQVDAPVDGRLPAGDAEGSAAAALGALWRFIDALATLHRRVAQPLPAADWPGLLAGLVDGFLQPEAGGADDATELRAALAALADQWQRSVPAQPLPLDVVRQALLQWLDDPARGGVPTGRITFSAMSSLRGLPYRMVCLLGLDDGAYPGAARPAEFDLMARHQRPGDRQRRTDERNLFLDLLLAARDRVHLSYAGRSVRDNAPRPPSVLVAELLDYLRPSLDAPHDAAQAHLVVEHPLQAFAEAPFQPGTDPRRRSFHHEYATALAAGRAARAGGVPAALPTTAADDADADADAGDDAADEADDGDDDRAADGPVPPFFTRPLAAAAPAPGPDGPVLSLARLQRFFRHPSRFLLQQRLGLTLRRPDEALADDEPFLPDHAARAALAERLLPALAAGADEATLWALAEAGTALPGGPFGRRFVANELLPLRRHAADLAALTATPPLPPHQATLVLDVGGTPWLLQAGFATLRPDGLLRHRYGDARATDYLDTWLDHLALCACAPAGVAGRTRWLGRDGPFSFRPVDDPLPLLQALLALYAQGQVAPLYFFPRSAWAYQSAGEQLAKARAAWVATAMKPYAEQADPAHRLVLRGLPDPLEGGLAPFQACARAVFAPLLQHLDDPRSA